MDLWAFPDATLNLVLVESGPTDEREYAFPCAPFQLVRVLRGETFRSANADGEVRLSRNGDCVAAELRPNHGKGWVQCVPVPSLASAIEALDPEASAYVG